MRTLEFILLAIGLCAVGGYSQSKIQVDQILISVEGLAPKYSAAFASNKQAIINAIVYDSLNITTRPLPILASNVKGAGMIQISIQYEKEALFDSSSMNYDHYRSCRMSGMRNFVSLYGVKQLMKVLESYRYKVALSAADTVYGQLIPNEEINSFYLCVRLIKNDRSWVEFFGTWIIDQNGVKRLGFDPDAIIKSKAGKPITFRAKYPGDELNGAFMFFLGKPFGLDGKPTEYFNVYKFFSIQIPVESK